MTRETVSTALGLVAMALRACKAELRDCTDLKRRKRLVARIEQLRVAHAELDIAAMEHNRERLDADLAGLAARTQV
jgi:hypothetical protein